ncbi:MAG: sigma 54 modulation/S30EA ribosomal C-terminal domain-containing protein, partial [Desulfovermiculus sp.]
ATRLQKSDDEFLVFLNAGANRVNVVYRLKNGDFGLIDPGV